MQAVQKKYNGFRRLVLPESRQNDALVRGSFYKEVIDAQHRELDNLLMKLGDLIRTRCAKPIICQALSEVAEFTLEHFEDEEKVMDAIGYPHLRAHREAHQLFMEELRRVSDEYSLTGELRAVELLEVLCDRTTKHLLVWDSGYGPYIESLG